jgi:hypothetical protein
MNDFSKPFISIILPAIRQDRWDDLYDSVLLACGKYTFELIFCGPLPLTEKLQAIPNVKYAKDLGSPTRASNIACSLAEGLLITWIADDCLMIEDSIDKNIDLLLSMGDDIKNVVIQKYYEAGNITKDEYLVINNSRNFSPYFSNSWVGFNNPIMYRKYYELLGGLDAYFDACPTAHNDLAVRAQAQGAIVKISQFPFLNCGWMEGGTGDHKAIYLSQEQVDEPKFRQRYHNPQWIYSDLNIPIDNWKLSQSIWNVRFKNGVPKTYQSILDENELASL